MKPIATFSLIFALTSSSLVFAQSGDMKGMDMKGMDNNKQSQSDKAMTHTATAVVKSVDPANGKVTLAHGPVKSLNWPAMTMGFAVKDKALLDKLAVGKKVKVEFTQEGNDYIVTSVK